MSGGAAVQCLPCGKKLVIRDMSSHIHEHIQYFPQSCKDCDFRCVNKSALDLHTFETDHTGSACFDPYKQWLVDTINDDCRFAAKFGVDELLKRKNITGHSPTQPSPIVTPAQQHQRRTSTVVPPLPLRYVALSSSDSDDEPQQVAARPKVPAVVVKRNSGVQSRRPEPPAKEKSEADDSEPSKDSDDEEIVKLRQELNNTVKCRLCTFKKHFVESHGSGTNWKLSLGNTRLERDFPAAFAEHRRMSGGAAVQCLPCGKKLVIRDMSSHIHEHIQYFPQSCKDCDFRCVNKSALDLHTFETDHTGSACFDPYKQWLVDTINDDCRFAAKFGVDELLKRKNITGHSPTQPSPIVTPAQQHQRRTSTVVPPLPLRYVALSSSDSDDEPQQVAARPKVPAVVVKRNSGVQSRRPEPPAKEKSEADDSEPSKDSDDEEIVKLRQELNNTVKCRLCTFKKHFVESHGSGTNWKLSLGNTRLERDFPAAFAEHRRKIEAISRLLFPLDLPLRILDEAKKKGKSRGGDYDDDNLLKEISASVAAAPSKPTDGRTAQKRRCSPVTPSGSKKCAAAVQKPRASVKQEIREEDQEEDSLDSSRATVAGATVNSKKNGEVVVKKEEDVKQERTATTTTTTVPQRSVVPPTVLRRTFPKKTSSMSPITKTSSMSPSTTGGQARHIQLMYNGRGGGWRGDRGRGGGWTGTIPLPSFNTASDGGYGRGR
ncbi:hypothetical protein PRIPAC_82842 [Pristionchus pacificus]|uniref:Uncharacterized protein n=1 Tax=Pristionchus pacificus TaxID=54126 RepID=A0A2A6CP71_PRIPA|nr:hypothetical protein PRIPAC_82842 [Pristionchus pacificus]|eukprot:PDM79821.1 hypothetical protein PRIPAC_32400 [Pristionchus pacificus]